MPEKKIKIPFPTPTSPPVDGSEVEVKESTERWSEFQLEDGSTIRVKPTVLGAIRIDNQYDPEGKPLYAMKIAQVVVVTDAPANLRKPVIGPKGIN